MHRFSNFSAVVLWLLVGMRPVLGAEYYVSSSGNDRNPGTSAAEAWNSLAKVNDFKFSPGDVIRFQCGGVWRGSLSPSSGSDAGHVTYTSFGEGKKPLLLGSLEKSSPSDWTRVGENLWSAGPFAVDVGSIIFNNGETCGFKVWKPVDLQQQNKFWYDQEDKVVKLYSARNPAEMYGDIECALKRHIINEGGKHYVIYDDLHLAYGAAHGIGGGGTHHIIVRNCDLSFIGGGHQFTKKTRTGQYPVRYGNGIEFWSSAHDNLVENCRIWDIYDAGLTNQGSSTNQQYNIVYRNNVIWNCEYSFEYWNRPETSTTHDIYFENNVCFNAGRGWSHGQPYDRGIHIMFFSNTAKTYNFYVRNNIFHRAESTAVVVSHKANEWNGLDNLVLDNNVYYQPRDKQLAWWGHWRDGKSFSPQEFDAYKKATGKDASSRLVTLRRLVVEPGEMKLRVGDTQRLEVTGQYSDGVTIDVTRFSCHVSSDSTIASVDSEGTTKGLRPGKAQITITFEGLAATASVTTRR